MDRWQGRVALVTGASAGIGAAVCCELAKQGMKVVGCARDVDRIVKLGEKLPEGSLLGIKCDLTKEDDIENLFKEIRQKFGRLDVCVNNAGIANGATILSGKTEEWRNLINVNVLALCICSREAVKLMRENEIDDGQIIQISSIAGHVMVPQAAVYCGTKFMVRAVTEGLRQELKAANSHIRVASISPGIVKTEIIHRCLPNDTAMADMFYNSLECMEAEDIASLVTSILQTPPRVNINDIIVRPVEQDF